MSSFNGVAVPSDGDAIQVEAGKFVIPDNPVIPFIEGDGTGRDIWKASRRVFDGAVKAAYGDSRKVAWYEIFAGQKAYDQFNSWLPEDTLGAIREFHVAIKGPLTTPVGGGIRSLNVALRQLLTLYVCMRPVRYFPGVPSPVRSPEKLDVVIFRENTEDVYAGIEWQQGTEDVAKVIRFLNDEMGKQFTEGAFRDWGYEVAKEEFADQCVIEGEFDGDPPAGKIVVNDRIADSMFQQVLLRPAEYDVLATTNLNGDYLSDACAAQVGGLGHRHAALLHDNPELGRTKDVVKGGDQLFLF